jgi:hypothetical protein
MKSGAYNQSGFEVGRLFIIFWPGLFSFSQRIIYVILNNFCKNVIDQTTENGKIACRLHIPVRGGAGRPDRGGTVPGSCEKFISSTTYIHIFSNFFKFHKDPGNSGEGGNDNGKI